VKGKDLGKHSPKELVRDLVRHSFLANAALDVAGVLLNGNVGAAARFLMRGIVPHKAFGIPFQNHGGAA
jgi:hypothetical protein